MNQVILNKFKGAWEELDQFLSTYDLSMLAEINKDQVHSLLEEIYPERISSKRIIKYKDHKKKEHTHTEYFINAEEAEAILKRARELNIPFKD
ncbi:hypothetical protein [Acinetobacter nosocomialis]|uniref:hypothetical protein n=1 Tax=Acinetobacter nosocomialis TaxID=106654 RepID=UPI00124FF546|nr:hypothetical protein [Acinetobacter nosocomialis]